jgi:hypothetical protein
MTLLRLWIPYRAGRVVWRTAGLLFHGIYVEKLRKTQTPHWNSNRVTSQIRMPVAATPAFWFVPITAYGPKIKFVDYKRCHFLFKDCIPLTIACSFHLFYSVHFLKTFVYHMHLYSGSWQQLTSREVKPALRSWPQKSCVLLFRKFWTYKHSLHTSVDIDWYFNMSWYCGLSLSLSGSSGSQLSPLSVQTGDLSPVTLSVQ